MDSIRNFIFYLTFILSSFIGLIFVSKSVFEAEFFHVKILLCILLCIIFILNLSFLIKDLIMLIKNEIPKDIFLTIHKDPGEQSLNIPNKILFPEKLSSNLISGIEHNYYSNQFLKEFNKENNENYNNFNLNGSDKKLGTYNFQNTYNKEENQKIQEKLSIKNSTVKDISSNIKSKYIKNFIKYNKFFFERDEKELLECNLNLNQKFKIRNHKFAKDSNTLIQINSLEFINKFQFINDENENYLIEDSYDFDRTKSKGNERNKKATILNIFNNNDIEQESYKVNLNLVDSFLSNNDNNKIIIEKEETLRTKNDQIVNGGTKTINQTKKMNNSIYQNIQIPSIHTEKKSSKCFLISEDSLKADNIDSIKKKSSSQLRNYKCEKSSTLNGKGLKGKDNNLFENFNEPINYHEFIVNEQRPIERSQKLYKKPTLKTTNKELNKFQSYINNNAIIDKKIPVIRKESMIPNLFLNDFNEINGNLIQNSNLDNYNKLIKQPSFIRKKFIKSSNTLKYSDLGNKLLNIDSSKNNNKGLINNLSCNSNEIENKNNTFSLIRNQDINNSNSGDSIGHFNHVMGKFDNNYINLKQIKSKFGENSNLSSSKNVLEKLNKEVLNKNFTTEILLKKENKLINKVYENEEIDPIRTNRSGNIVSIDREDSDKNTVISLMIPTNYKKKINNIENKKNKSTENIISNISVNKIEDDGKINFKNLGKIKNNEELEFKQNKSYKFNSQTEEFNPDLHKMENNHNQKYGNNLATILSNTFRKNEENSMSINLSNNELELSNYDNIQMKRKEAQVIISSNSECSSADDSEESI